MADEQQGMYVSNRNFTAYTTKGHVLRFNKGEPKYVPPLVREEMLAHGILPVDGDLPVAEAEERPREPIGAERTRRMDEAVAAVVSTNHPDDFTGGGVPKEAAIEKVAGFRISRKEINDAYKRYKAKASEQE